MYISVDMLLVTSETVYENIHLCEIFEIHCVYVINNALFGGKCMLVIARQCRVTTAWLLSGYQVGP